MPTVCYHACNTCRGQRFFCGLEAGRLGHKKPGSPPRRAPRFETWIPECTARLPAAVPTATTAAIAAVTIPATSTAAAATTAAASPSTTAKAAPATAAARASSATAATLTRRTSFVDDNVAAHEIVAVQSLDGALGFLVAIDFDKSEPAWLP